ncbi:MAG: beta-ketoacyl synthase chain length factor [Deltaproteobacteria bacterium]|nr:beta-ketoacyl synthase chain length factor [Deltaproteobacteria bacterium]
MRLYIHGIGTLSRGLDEPFEQRMSSLEDIPIKDYARPAFRRRFAKLSKMTYIAATRAIADAGVENPSELSIVGFSALGETTVSLDLLAQIRKSMGRTLRPWLVPNSVHNAPAGYLSIGLENHEPSLTVSQGRLAPEAGLTAAEDLLATGAAKQALIVGGDEADPNWVTRLEEAGSTYLAEKLAAERFQEGAVAIVVGKTRGGRDLGSVLAGVERADANPDGIAALLKKYSVTPGPDAEIRARVSAGGKELLEAIKAATQRDTQNVLLDGPGLGTSQVGSLSALAASIRNGKTKELLTIGCEVDELAFLHWVR